MTLDNDDLERRAMQALETVFDQPSDKRKTWAQTHLADDKALLDRVLSLLDAESESTDSLQTGGAYQLLEDDFHPERAGAYKITSLIGRGGMGAVYAGERDTGDFEHHVAIKVIRPGIFSDALVERFENERRILAKLNHSGIARLFSGGTLEDGSPFIVMEYVDGTPITEWVEQKKLSVDDRLWLFGDICSAVQYAHQNLVIHRDITPSNVMVDNKGAVKLIDFGIAKPQSLEAGQAPAVEGSLASLSFTPGFAAPERQRGAPANTLSDIFSLGKLLSAMLESVATDADLKAIIARASATDPDNRYPSVSALSDDIRNYRTGYPVEAREGGGLYVLKKYLGRRRYFVGFSALAATALVAAFGATAVAYLNAEEQKRRAEARFDQARSLSQTLLEDVYDDIALVPGTLEARTTFAEILRDYNDTLAADPLSPLDVQRDVAAQYARLSRIYSGLGEASLNDVDTGIELLQQSEAQLRRLIAANPNDLEAHVLLLNTLRMLAVQTAVTKGDLERGSAINADAEKLGESALEQFGEDMRLRSLTWEVRSENVNMLILQSRFEEAIALSEAHSEAVEAERDLIEHPDVLLADLNTYVGEALVDLERFEEALAPLRRARDALERSLETKPNNYNRMVKLLRAANMLSAAERGVDDPAALSTAQLALDVARSIRDADPADVNGQIYVSVLSEQLAKTLLTKGEEKEALRLAQEAVDTRVGVVKSNAANSQHRRDLSITLYTLAGIQGAVGDEEAACATLERALDNYRELESEDLLTAFETETARPVIQNQYDTAKCGS